MFINIADSYWGGGGGNYGLGSKSVKGRAGVHLTNVKNRLKLPGLKSKDLCGIPQRLALALQNDGWFWRSEVTWCKTSPLPESVRDRPTRATEKVLLFSKSPHYFYDAEAVRQESGTGWRGSSFTSTYDIETKPGLGHGPRQERMGHNLWDYWVLGSEPSSCAHYATMPTALAKRCILAGSPEKCCPQCKTPYVRQTEITYHNPGNRRTNGPRSLTNRFQTPGFAVRLEKEVSTSGFAPGCNCVAQALSDGCRDVEHMEWLTTPVPSVVFDPFLGSGTTVCVARTLGRHGIGTDLSLPYLYLARERLGLTDLDAWLGKPSDAKAACDVSDLPLFGPHG